MSVDVRLIVILDPAALGGTGPAVEAARAAQVGGATALQLRDKSANPGDLLTCTRLLVTSLSIPVWVNDRADVAWAAGCAGIHTGADDIPAGRLRRIAGPEFRIGVSVGSAAEARAVMDAAPDYWSVGPVNATPTKPDAGVPLGVGGFEKFARLAPPGLPVIAIGGVTAGDVGPLVAAGAAGVAVSSAVFHAPDVERATRALRRAIDEATEPPG